ncbi:MAG: c-type cytochrome biogenesis protein CcmI [Ferrovum sp. 37-45-19]|jgi:cytochrome c-type biogenesis protein CcmH|uniref:c-type cytochrome biogenesis protein CcmI n=1 Tax=Ferrovum sp. JA12 TaxID=1356299 RepID=UPI000702AEB0|nr:c-type cytochrome biogenesis protein CcmI [Ferrovum sp. JA12]OYV79757.1 MAG: c-type cytochrome biogenesis protein CcmI [Ferrovum sp. 21-44-67]OYV95379.1 MAG: c-type cytochrome biogenesis protein CcmI [Ferrovum sp. 37-45-19]OZB31438.1 MAG: c-type cytochrome biogenesis protein CcmI [Ferrovum sp. 34-44-207]HQT81170.1 c-type cytochrome biogenesis protein CcmI [Ferrovaceae bacterium]KRH78056.1 formate-dependent nitrite reductase complex subunit NrfG [Ferrovum sp. JA12]
MISFIIAASLLLIIIAAILLWVARHHHKVNDNQKALNVAVYRDQLTELQEELKAGSMAEEDFTQASSEIQRRLLEDTVEQHSVTEKSSDRRWIWGAVVLIPLLTVSMYLWRGHWQVFQPESMAPTDQQISAMVEGLAAKLAKNPNDPKGWSMLAHSYMTLNRPLDAVNAFAHIENTMNDDPTLMADYAEALVASGVDKGFVHAQVLVAKVLKLEPGNPKALYLHGGFLFAQNDYKGAEESWKKLIPLIDPSSSDAKFVLDSINQARIKQHLSAMSMNDFQGQEGPVSTPESLANSSADTKATAVSGTVTLDEKLKSKVSGQEIVFIFARATNGPRMPLAVLRIPVTQLPYHFELTKNMAMSPNFNLSTVSEVTVEAKISRSGTATPSAGDLIGKSVAVKPGSHDVQVLINQVTP